MSLSKQIKQHFIAINYKHRHQKTGPTIQCFLNQFLKRNETQPVGTYCLSYQWFAPGDKPIVAMAPSRDQSAGQP